MSRERKKRKVNKQFLFFVEGETEKVFFDTLWQEYRLTSAKTIKILKNSGTDWVEKSQRMIKNNSRVQPNAKTTVFIVFDKNNDTDSQIKAMIQKSKRLKIGGSKCEICFSNESFELWLLAYFEKITPGFKTQKQLNLALSKYLGETYVKADSVQMQRIIKENRTLEAIENSESISEFSLDHQSTNVGSILKEILSELKSPTK
ncbi:RloB family protein [Secundilactobacillus paracollinoides]|uniref:Abortive phage resistance protein n=1 Tax=Secundilactobacillus paracollinoides TaxID=240427 RepID=A0A1B2J1Z6_9LACO|nr:RloB family protein [Secundilactobacillus paracollinoides]ANZ62384.1 hypothetical protein AYR61_14285 [Secundilactobacillus paracollinoides]ANZ68335.1 hypothetical protein AYR63_15185 [Secundilactobacillus paracollinoides]